MSGTTPLPPTGQDIFFFSCLVGRDLEFGHGKGLLRGGGGESWPFRPSSPPSFLAAAAAAYG